MLHLFIKNSSALVSNIFGKNKLISYTHPKHINKKQKEYPHFIKPNVFLFYLLPMHLSTIFTNSNVLMAKKINLYFEINRRGIISYFGMEGVQVLDMALGNYTSNILYY